MSSIKGIIFDYGGTIDTNGIHWGELIWQEYCNANVGVSKELFREAYVHGERTLAKERIIEPTDTFLTLLRKKMKIQFGYLKGNYATEPLTAQKELEVADACYQRVLNTLATTRIIIEELGKRFPLVLVTNFYGNMPVVLQEFGLSHLFKDIIESSVVGIRKPDPELFALGVKALGIESKECVVIGDSYRKDITPAAQLGCKSVWLKKICWSEEDIEPGFEPSNTIESLEELPHIIDSYT